MSNRGTTDRTVLGHQPNVSSCSLPRLQDSRSSFRSSIVERLSFVLGHTTMTSLKEVSSAKGKQGGSKACGPQWRSRRHYLFHTVSLWYLVLSRMEEEPGAGGGVNLYD